MLEERRSESGCKRMTETAGGGDTDPHLTVYIALDRVVSEGEGRGRKRRRER